MLELFFKVMVTKFVNAGDDQFVPTAWEAIPGAMNAWAGRGEGKARNVELSKRRQFFRSKGRKSCAGWLQIRQNKGCSGIAIPGHVILRCFANQIAYLQAGSRFDPFQQSFAVP